jgi:ribosomal protein L22
MADEEKKANAKKAAKKPAAKKTAKAPAKKAAAKKPAAKKATTKKAAEQETTKKPAAKRTTAKQEGAKAEGRAPARKPAKKARPAPVAPPTVRARARYVRIAPRKARLVADQVRGLHIEKARALLQFSPRGAARDIHKLIDSAAANAETNHDLIGDEMRISSITVDEGPTLKRYRPRAQGRATPIHKRTSHIAVALTPVED